MFLKEFLNQEPVKELGISEESLSITVDRLTSTRDKEAQAKEFKKLLSDATLLQDKGDIDKALELIDSKLKEVKLKDKATEFSSLLKLIKEDELKERQRNKPESLNSGYTIGGEPLLLPSGAISILCAPTSHGKTTFLINLALNIATAYPDKETYLFSYEEDEDSILINTLNTYLDEELSGNNRTTLKNYFTGSNKRVLPVKKDEFFKELIETRRLNINYSSYSSDTLIEAIRYLHKHAKPGAIFIDYIQLLNLPEGKYKTYSRQEEIKEICIALKDVAVETGLPIILGAQFNREVVNQIRIHATKIGEAGDIERIANLIVGFWNNNFQPLASEGEINEIKEKGCNSINTLYTKILKNRGGIVGLEEILSFNGNTGKIKNRELSSSSGSNYFK
jgi:replicative DNA helicase